MKMWSGRFENESDKLADDFNSSLSVDKRMYRHDIMGSIAHCTMLGACKIISMTDSEKINCALQQILRDIDSGSLIIENAEDIHMFVEAELTRRIGDTGKRLHTARSRNDQVALDIRLYLLDSIDSISDRLKLLINEMLVIAQNNLTTIIPAYTHMQKAQPTTLAHYFMAYVEMFKRDIDRMKCTRERTAVMPLGSGACAGTTFPIDRELVAKLLGLKEVSRNSLDAVSDRDFALEFIFNCSTIMVHLSRINEEIIYWATDEFRYIGLDDKFSTGSSIMPQKKNPDMSELIRGKSGRVFGDLTAMLTMMKGLPLAYNKDMQEDKEAIFDAEDTVKACLDVFTAMLPTLKYNVDNLLNGASGGYTVATDCADYLVRCGMPFREAHSVIGKLVIYCGQNNLTLDKLTLAQYKSFSPLFEQDILECVKLENVVGNRKIIGAPSPQAVAIEIERSHKFINDDSIKSPQNTSKK